MKLTHAASFLIGFYIALLFFWLFSGLFANGGSSITLATIFTGFKHSTQYGYIFSFVYGFIPFIGSIIGFRISKSWGFFKESVGKAVFFLSLSLFSWSMGEFIWAYYNFFLNATVPYPSWADVGFVLNYPFWGIGMVYLGNASGARMGLQKTGRKLLLIIIPVVVSLFSWYIMVDLARAGSITSGGGFLKVFFDIAYPVGDVILMTMGLLIFGLSFRYWGNQLKWPITIILLGIALEYIADFGFSYTTTVNTFYNGSWVDLVFTTSLTILGLGVAMLDVKEKPSSAGTVTAPAISPTAPPSSLPNIPPVPPASPTV